MAELAEFELSWLEYARKVVNVDDAHLKACKDAGGVPDPLDGSRTLRWPGYLGRNYQPGLGVLCVAQVHRDINAESEHVDPDVNVRYVASTAAWKARALSDVEFLEETRLAYEHWIPAWGRWKRHFRYLVEELVGLGIDRIAWANLAKCQAPTNSSPEGVIETCRKGFPIRDLVDAIRPRVVLCARLRGAEGEPTVAEWGTRPVYRFHYRWGTNLAGESLQVWGPRMAATVRLPGEPHREALNESHYAKARIWAGALVEHDDGAGRHWEVLCRCGWMSTPFSSPDRYMDVYRGHDCTSVSPFRVLTKEEAAEVMTSKSWAPADWSEGPPNQ